jgi:hypothetical protein
MSQLPSYPWCAYACRQAKLAEEHTVNHQSWGLEAELNRLLATIGQSPSNDEELDRVGRSESRRERNRARLRRVHLVATDVAYRPDGALDAQQQLRAVREHVNDNDWALLNAIGEGRDYKEIAAAKGISAGGLRVRVLRLRHGLTARQEHFGGNPQGGRRAA